MEKYLKFSILITLLLPVFAIAQDFSYLVNEMARQQNMKLRETCVSLVSSDLDRIQQEAIQNGMNEEEISGIQKAYVNEILSEFRKNAEWQLKEFGEGDYMPLRGKIITPIARLHFNSDPANSTVSIVNTADVIGMTSTSKLFDKGIELTFKFELDGYEPAQKKYRVMSYPKDQYLHVYLVKTNGKKKR